MSESKEVKKEYKRIIAVEKINILGINNINTKKEKKSIRKRKEKEELLHKKEYKELPMKSVTKKYTYTPILKSMKTIIKEQLKKARELKDKRDNDNKDNKNNTDGDDENESPNRSMGVGTATCIDKQNKNKVTYKTGSLENPDINKQTVNVLEGTRPAFDLRDSKYQPES